MIRNKVVVPIGATALFFALGCQLKSSQHCACSDFSISSGALSGTLAGNTEVMPKGKSPAYASAGKVMNKHTREELALELLGTNDPNELMYYNVLPILLTDYEGYVKPRLTLRFAPLKRAEEYDYVRREIGDICLTASIMVDGPDGTQRPFKLVRKLLFVMGVTEDDLFADAQENTRRLSKPVFGNPEEIGLNGSDEGTGMLACYDANEIAGSAIFALPEFCGRVASRVGSDFYVLPSSVNELVFLPASRYNPLHLKALLISINSSGIPSKDEFLSDSVYLYRIETRTFGLCL